MLRRRNSKRTVSRRTVEEPEIDEEEHHSDAEIYVEPPPANQPGTSGTSRFDGWGRHSRLSEIEPLERRAELYLKVARSFIPEKNVNRENLARYGVTAAFDDKGWGGVLDIPSDYYYPDAVKAWMSTLQKRTSIGGSIILEGMVEGLSYTMTMPDIRRLLSVDVHVPNRVYLEKEPPVFPLRSLGWREQIKEVYDISEEKALEVLKLERHKLSPICKVLHRIVISNVNPRTSDTGSVRENDLPVLYYLMTNGNEYYSYAYIVMKNIWRAFDNKQGAYIPHVCLISRLLEAKGAFVGARLHTTQSLLDFHNFKYLRFMSFRSVHSIYDTETRRHSMVGNEGIRLTEAEQNQHGRRLRHRTHDGLPPGATLPQPLRRSKTTTANRGTTSAPPRPSFGGSSGTFSGESRQPRSSCDYGASLFAEDDFDFDNEPSPENIFPEPSTGQGESSSAPRSPSWQEKAIKYLLGWTRKSDKREARRIKREREAAERERARDEEIRRLAEEQRRRDMASFQYHESYRRQEYQDYAEAMDIDEPAAQNEPPQPPVYNYHPPMPLYSGQEGPSHQYPPPFNPEYQDSFASIFDTAFYPPPPNN